MKKEINHYLSVLLTALFLLVATDVFSKDVGPDDLEGDDRIMFDRFRDLFQYGSPEQFFRFARDYERDLKKKEYMMLYYKLLNNEGFYALRHNMIYRAMEMAKRLDGELRADEAHDYYYLATGLMGDVYFACHNRHKAEGYFIRALEEVGDRDPKFTMRCYHTLAEMLALSNPQEALEWMGKARTLALETENVEYQSLTYSMTGFIHFLTGNSEGFFRSYDEYISLRSMDKPGFSTRYANILEVGRLSFGGKYEDASFQLGHSGTVYVDSSLVAIRIFAMERDVDKGYEAMKRRYLEMDSVYSVMQDANFDQMTAEHLLLKSQEEALDSKKLAQTLYYVLMGLVVFFLVIYIMGRRRLMLKIWDRNRELKVALEKAEESDRMKTAFIQNMSHEIRTPLNAVAGFSQLLCAPDYALDEKEKQNMQHRIMENVRLITSTVNELLELSKSESEGQGATVEKTEFLCNDLARAALNEVKGKQKTGVELSFVSNVDDGYKIFTNAYRLRSALLHLLDNAVKFTEKGSVELACELKDRKMLFSVTDTGVGIKEEDRERIFETFQKIDTFKSGIGLGLPLSRRMVRTLGGDVELDTSYTNGSRFVISIPLK